MKKKKSNKKGKVNRRSVKLRPLQVFGLTLGIVLLLGLLLIAGTKFLTESGDKQEKKQEQKQEEEASVPDDKTQILWEKVLYDEPEVKETAAATVVSSRYAGELADEEYRKENRIYAWEASGEEEVTIGFIGDILFDDEYAIMANLLRRGGTIDNGISPALLEKLQEVDILVANNEFPYTNRGTPTEDKTFTFRADTGTAAYLHDMGVDAAVLANNHIYDFGEIGLLDTLDTLSQA
ncbi:MAG: CapA family protein, partial [Lachnospiraceae bacterium]|nr:CapA family protein [Lachnospiraceae bacterium]